ncbi:MAG: glycosyltransferase family 2 protein [Gammaproteobacteria bacterium]|nr:glycosyltransferase family 2 protein [Gammaproteobacteria bacterium]
MSVIVPVYNEVASVEPVTGQISGFLRGRFEDYEVILVESGSTDGSCEACDRAAAVDPRVRVVHEGARNGFGAALKVGYAAAEKNLIWLVTVDLPFALETIDRALPLLAEHDCVLSFRARDRRSLGRRAQSWAYNVLVRSLLGLRVRHVNSAFKLFRRELVQGLVIESNGWFVDAEILFRLQRQGVRFAEIPVELLDRTEGRSSVGTGAAWSVLRDLLSFALRHRVALGGDATGGRGGGH